MSKKKKFHVESNESIDQCLDRMKKEGYMPIRRMEQPIFKEVIEGGIKKHIPIGRDIIFEGKLMT